MSESVDEESTGQDDKLKVQDEAIKKAMARELKLTDQEVDTRVAQQAAAADVDDVVQKDVRKSLADDFAGSYIDQDSGSLMVATTDSAHAAEVQAVGARHKVATYSERQLRTAQKALDDEAGSDSKVVSTDVELMTNAVVLTVLEGSETEAQRLISNAGVVAGLVRVETSKSMNKTTSDIVGGERYVNPEGAGCSMGFHVRDFRNGSDNFVTAGHCARLGDGGSDVDITNGQGKYAGRFQKVQYPDRDLGVVRTNNRVLRPVPRIKSMDSLGNRRDVVVNDLRPVPLGTFVCRSGFKSGLRCGKILSKNYTANVSEGKLNNMVRLATCASPGDSGGPVFTYGGNVQGVVSGAVGGETCSTTKTGNSFYQPVTNTILDEFSVDIVRGN